MPKNESFNRDFFENNHELIQFLEDINIEINDYKSQVLKAKIALSNPANEPVKELIENEIANINLKILDLEQEKNNLKNTLDSRFCNYSNSNTKEQTTVDPTPHIPEEVNVGTKPNEIFKNNSKPTQSTNNQSSRNENKESSDEVKVWHYIWFIPLYIAIEAFQNPKTTAKVAAISGAVT
jgi:hypothetical protein